MLFPEEMGLFYFWQEIVGKKHKYNLKTNKFKQNRALIERMQCYLKEHMREGIQVLWKTWTINRKAIRTHFPYLCLKTNKQTTF